MKSEQLLVTGGQVFLEGGLEPADVLIEAGRIVGVGENLAAAKAAQVFSASGLLVCAGYIDLEIHGGFGLDFTSAPDSMWEVGASLPRFGVTAFLAAIITAEPPTIERAAAVFGKGPPSGYKGAVPLGLHLEGPMLSPEFPGAHSPELLVRPSLDLIEDWTREGGVRLVTLAPELPGADPVIAELRRRGIVIAAGHSAATFEEAREAFELGVTLGTHLFNAMAPFQHRRPGLTGALLTAPQPAVSLIADGIHTHPAAIRLAWLSKGSDRVILITDAMAAMGAGPGEYKLGDVEVTVTDKGPRNADGTLTGSVLELDQAVRNLRDMVDCPPAAATIPVTANPARLIGETDRGEIAVGRRGDLTVLDEQLNVVATVVAGELMYQAP